MEKHHRAILVEMRRKIVDDLDVFNGILDPLKDEYVLRNEDVEKIKAGKTMEEQAEILLDTLPYCGPYAFDVFHRALNPYHNWLYLEIETILQSRRLDLYDMGRVSPGSPNLPPQPEMTVTREAKMIKLKDGLQKLKPGSYLALHGMKGFGKSCLTANTLKDAEFVKTAFNNKVYWIKFGSERLGENEIFIQLNFLYHQVRNSENLDAVINSEPLKEHLVHYLRSYFNNENNRRALLILDDVWSKKIIDVFDFHCKTLVITTDIDFLDGKHRDIIEMNDGFTEAESLGLFAKVLETEIDNLPPQAKKIHAECNGMPILIAMFAAQFEEFKDDMRMYDHRWQYYLDSLRNMDSSNKVIRKFLTKQEAIFDMCIDMLPPDAKTKYEALAIFNQDVNIMPQTLEILWDEEPYRVEDHMLDLCHKSLAAKHWNVDLKSYVYGVHDLLLSHLRSKMSPEKLRDLHRSFIEKYRKYCNDDFSKLPNDNYSFSYIGHHLEQSEMHEQFPKLYLNFDFMREKIYHTGLRDLLIDMKKYRNLLIAGDKEAETNVRDVENFLENQAAVIAEHSRRQCLDLTQIGINSTTGYVRKESALLAASDPTKLYVTHDHSSRMLYSTVTSEEVCTRGTNAKTSTACFTDDENKILVGNHSGEVVMLDCNTRTQTVFSGHGKSKIIRKIIVASEQKFFLTLCDDGRVKLFLLPEYESNGHESDDQTTPVQSPRDKQPHWNEMFRDNSSRDDSSATFWVDDEMITDVALSQNDERIGVCTDSGTIKVWKTEGETLYHEKVAKHSFKRITFTREGSMIHVLDSDGVLKFYVEQIALPVSFVYISTYNLKLAGHDVILLQAPPRSERSLIVVGDSKALYVKWNEVCDPKYPTRVSQVHSFKKKSCAEIQNKSSQKEKWRFTCATLTYDGQYIVTGDSKGFISVWNIYIGIGEKPIATLKARVDSLDTYWLDEGSHMICGSWSSIIHRWTLALEKLPESVRKPFFDAVMKPWGEVNVVAKETPENTIVLCHGDKTIAETAPVNGEIVHLSLNSRGDKIVYATDKGVITLFDKDTEKSISIDKLETTPGIVKFVEMDGSTAVVYGEDDNVKVSLQSSTEQRATVLLEETGRVMSIHTIGKICVVTVARNGDVIFWSVRGTIWTSIKMLSSCAKDDSLRYSCLSPNNRSLTVLTNGGKMIIYTVEFLSANPLQIETDILTQHFFNQKLSCCDYSQDDNYLAIGLENGEISIFDMTGLCEVTRLELHCNKVRQLHWSPFSIGPSILLSVNSDELAWWNVAALLNKKKQGRRSRMGTSRSSQNLGPSPRSSVRVPTSQSLDSEISNRISKQLQALTQQPTNGDSSDRRNSDVQTIDANAEAYWRNKTAKHSNRPGLLSVVPLPASCNSKICVSDDFSKFLSVDVHGSVTNFELHNYK